MNFRKLIFDMGHRHLKEQKSHFLVLVFKHLNLIRYLWIPYNEKKRIKFSCQPHKPPSLAQAQEHVGLSLDHPPQILCITLINISDKSSRT